MKRSRRMSDSLPAIDPNAIFPLLLAAIFSNSECLIKKCLNKLRRNSLPQSHSQLIPVLSVFPILLNSKDEGICSRTAEILGETSLVSLEMNEQIASDFQTSKALVSLVTNSEKDVSVTACNALLDLCTTSVGRQQLLHFSAVNTLMFLDHLFLPFCAPGVMEIFPLSSWVLRMMNL